LGTQKSGILNTFNFTFNSAALDANLSTATSSVELGKEIIDGQGIN
jgi:hypothetical protein